MDVPEDPERVLLVGVRSSALAYDSDEPASGTFSFSSGVR